MAGLLTAPLLPGPRPHPHPSILQSIVVNQWHGDTILPPVIHQDAEQAAGDGLRVRADVAGGADAGRAAVAAAFL